MIRDDIIRMARDCGAAVECGAEILAFEISELEAFAALVAAAEREEFAKHSVQLIRDAVAEAKANEREECWQAIEAVDGGEAPEYRICQEAIRARGN